MLVVCAMTALSQFEQIKVLLKRHLHRYSYPQQQLAFCVHYDVRHQALNVRRVYIILYFFCKWIIYDQTRFSFSSHCILALTMGRDCYTECFLQMKSPHVARATQ